MPTPLRDARGTALGIWHAAVAAVDSTRLVEARMRVEGTRLAVEGGERIEHDFGTRGRLLVVGAGKAGAGMSDGVQCALRGTALEARITGWVNVPADCVRPCGPIHLHAARPAGLNEPTAEGCIGTEHILSLVSGAEPHDLALVLISGGGSALLPAPVDGVTLGDKQQVTRLLSGRGATIHELNTVRKRISRVKGGGLSRAARCPVVSLVISDVIGDPLDIIASGPTVPDSSTAADALAVLERFDPGLSSTPPSIVSELEHQCDALRSSGSTEPSLHPAHNLVIGNNRIACEAALGAATQLGFDARLIAVDQPGVAEEVGRELARFALGVQATLRSGQPPVCLVSGGEPVVRLAQYDGPRKGGRNQQLALAALIELGNCDGITLLSGGTDGEDGPTDAAGAVVDREVVARAMSSGLDSRYFLSINNAYEFFDRTGGLLRTGPTHTNTMDVRVVVIEPPG
jgi:glycerate 2-kinase